jgi:hypothetical protein
MRWKCCQYLAKKIRYGRNYTNAHPGETRVLHYAVLPFPVTGIFEPSIAPRRKLHGVISPWSDLHVMSAEEIAKFIFSYQRQLPLQSEQYEIPVRFILGPSLSISYGSAFQQIKMTIHRRKNNSNPAAVSSSKKYQAAL